MEPPRTHDIGAPRTSMSFTALGPPHKSTPSSGKTKKYQTKYWLDQAIDLIKWLNKYVYRWYLFYESQPLAHHLMHINKVAWHLSLDLFKLLTTWKFSHMFLEDTTKNATRSLINLRPSLCLCFINNDLQMGPHIIGHLGHWPVYLCPHQHNIPWNIQTNFPHYSPWSSDICHHLAYTNCMYTTPISDIPWSKLTSI